MKILLLPLDDRPVNCSLPTEIAAIAGVEVVLPPASLLPDYRRPAPCDELVEWVAEQPASPVVASLDLVCHGGLIGSRIGHDDTATATHRLERFLALGRPTEIMATVMRASDADNPSEEPDYWATHGRAIHKLGADHHRAFIGELDEVDASAVPEALRLDFFRRRLRNHQIVLRALEARASGLAKGLVITADDTAPRAAGTLEQVWYRQWVRQLELEDAVGIYPGADEVGSVLVARVLGEALDTKVRIHPVFTPVGGEQLVANFENSPIRESVARQIVAAGAEVASADGADAVLVVHCPDPNRGDAFNVDLHPDRDAIAQTVAAVAAAPDGRPLGLADVRYSNGSDPWLVDDLLAAGQVERLTHYAGWNTAGNTVGTVVAALVASVVGRRTGQLDAAAERKLLLKRLLEDDAFMSHARRELISADPELGVHVGVQFDVDDPRIESSLQSLGEGLAEQVQRYPGGAGCSVTELRLPWRRLFEIDFDLGGLQ